MFNNSTEKVLTSVYKVRFGDCDPFKHLNNLKYIEYFINAREDQLLEYYDLDIHEYIKRTGEGWVVATNKIAYIRSAMLMESVLIESQLISYSPRSLHVEMRMFDSSRAHIKSVMWINFAYISIAKAKGAKHSQQILDFFENIVEPVEQQSFDERNTYLRRRQV